MRKSLVLVTLCLSVLLAGCETTSPLRPGASLNVSAAASQSLRLENASGRPIYYLVFESNLAERALWVPCTSPEQPCPRLEAGRTVQIDYSQIAGYEPGARTAIVYWWHLVRRDGGWEVDHIRSVVVQL